MTAAEFIDAKGGATKVADATGHKAGAVALWRHRNKLPRGAWPEIIDAYPEVSMADLRAIEALSTTPERPGEPGHDEAAA